MLPRFRLNAMPPPKFADAAATPSQPHRRGRRRTGQGHHAPIGERLPGDRCRRPVGREPDGARWTNWTNWTSRADGTWWRHWAHRAPGAPGPQGRQGDVGAAGLQGPASAQGASFLIEVAGNQVRYVGDQTVGAMLIAPDVSSSGGRAERCSPRMSTARSEPCGVATAPRTDSNSTASRIRRCSGRCSRSSATSTTSVSACKTRPRPCT